MKIYKQAGSKFFTADFTTSGGVRIRRSTKQTNVGKAWEIAAEFLRQAQDGETPTVKSRAPRLRDYVERKFLPFVKLSSLDGDTKRYYATGWRLLSQTDAVNWRLDQVTRDRADTLQLPGSGSNKNCALRTLRRILSHAEGEKLLKHPPKLKYHGEVQREHTYDPATEAEFLRSACQPLKDVFLAVEDAGMRPDEVIRMQKSQVLWRKALIFVPSGKTENAHRHVPLSDRLRDALKVRAEATTSEWLFPSLRSRSGHIGYSGVAKAFRLRRNELGISKNLVLYSARHTFGSELMDDLGDLTKVGKVLGHGSTRITERYIHPRRKAMASGVNRRNARRAQEAARHSSRHSGVEDSAEDAVND